MQDRTLIVILETKISILSRKTRDLILLETKISNLSCKIRDFITLKMLRFKLEDLKFVEKAPGN